MNGDSVAAGLDRTRSGRVRAFARWSAATAAATYLLLLLGGVVSSSGAGLACPDWPLCHGRLIPPLEPLVLIEWTHRLVASVIGLLVVFTAVLGWRAVNDADRRTRTQVRGAIGLGLGLLAVQVVLGGMTVLYRLPPAVTTAHLATGMALFATLVYLAYKAARLARAAGGPGAQEGATPAAGAVPSGFRGLAHATAAATYALIVLGGYVRHSGAALACPDWPLCHGAVIPELRGVVAIQFAHRAGALVVTALVLGTAILARRRLQAWPALVTATTVAAVLLAVQVMLGAWTVWSRVAMPQATAHLGGAAALLATLTLVLAMTADASAPGRAAPSGSGRRAAGTALPGGQAG